jgi:hypothetical protein
MVLKVACYVLDFIAPMEWHPFYPSKDKKDIMDSGTALKLKLFLNY